MTEPVNPVGYGVDTWCLDTYQPGRYARGRQVPAQALYRRLNTPRGVLRGGEEEARYGLDVANFVGKVGYQAAVAAIPGRVRAEVLKDERVVDAAVRATIAVADNGEISIEVELSVALTDGEDPLSLTLGVSDVGLDLIGGMPEP